MSKIIKLKLLRPYQTLVEGDIMEVGRGVAELLVQQGIAKDLNTRTGIKKKKKIKNKMMDEDVLFNKIFK